jgi:hypothetical protein
MIYYVKLFTSWYYIFIPASIHDFTYSYISKLDIET